MSNITVIKRDGRNVDFDRQKIVNAILSAFKDVDGEVSKYARERANNIADYVESHAGKRISVEDIQDMVEQGLVSGKRADVGKSYIIYRYEHAIARQRHNDNEIFQIINNDPNGYWSHENSNKNANLVTVQRDYLAGITSTDIARNYIFPKKVVEAHDDGIVHQHDMDYMAQSTLTNCFSADTKFVTSDGVRTFNDFYDGSPVVVRDMDGKWREATVHNFGKQILYSVTLQAGHSKQTVRCTRTHRWVLSDGTVTSNLQVGDVLAPLVDTSVSVNDIETLEDATAFCFGFVLGDGSDIANSRGVHVRLCGNKVKFASVFKQAGYQLSETTDGDLIATCKNAPRKQEFLTNREWRFMSSRSKAMLFAGYYAADGCVERNSLSTTDERCLELVEDISCVAGYYISSIRHDIRDTNFKKNSLIHTVIFRKYQNVNNLWRVKSIEKDYNNNSMHNVWCVTEPVTHTFTLANGIVTGNCELINLNDMLQNGTAINKVKIKKPHRLITAMTITTQIMASVAANTYGGESINLTHLAPFVRDSYNYYLKKYSDKSLGLTDKQIKALADRDLKKEIQDSVQTFNYQISTLFTLNGQAPFCSVFMYLNDTEEYKSELIMLIKEFLKQRMEGMPNRDGIKVTQAFPKLLYVLEEDNYKPGTKYWPVTKMAIKCSSNRLTPDYISEKKMKEYKINGNGDGDCYACMGKRKL